MESTAYSISYIDDAICVEITDPAIMIPDDEDVLDQAFAAVANERLMAQIQDKSAAA